MNLPDDVIPMLKMVNKYIRPRKAPLDFWQSENGPLILDGFMYLAALLAARGELVMKLPRGYGMIDKLFNWEARCQSDGWNAFRRIGEAEFSKLCELFSEVGLELEARSLIHQMTVYRQNPENDELLYDASAKFRHKYSGDLDRLEYLTQYFCDNANELLYLNA